MDTDKIKIITLLASILTLFIIEAAARCLPYSTQLSTVELTCIVRIIEITILILVIIYFENNLSCIGINKKKICSGIFKGVLWSSVLGLIVLFFSFIIYFAGKNPFKVIQVNIPENFTDSVLLFITGGIISPICEEIFFRGILYGFLRRYGFFAAIFLSTLIFAFSHLQVCFIQIIGGFIFAAAYEKEGTLSTPITIHTLGNLTIFFFNVNF